LPYLDRGGVRINYEVHRGNDAGGSLPLLLTHGFGASAQMWAPNTAALSAERLLIRSDMRGHGRSDCPEDQAAYTQPACISDMAALLDECGASRAIVGGLSLGG